VSEIRGQRFVLPSPEIFAKLDVAKRI
jgi:hypothetical protein